MCWCILYCLVCFVFMLVCSGMCPLCILVYFGIRGFFGNSGECWFFCPFLSLCYMLEHLGLLRCVWVGTLSAFVLILFVSLVFFVLHLLVYVGTLIGMSGMVCYYCVSCLRLFIYFVWFWYFWYFWHFNIFCNIEFTDIGMFVFLNMLVLFVMVCVLVLSCVSVLYVFGIYWICLFVFSVFSYFYFCIYLCSACLVYLICVVCLMLVDIVLVFLLSFTMHIYIY